MAEYSIDISSTTKEFYSYLKNYILKKVSNPHIAEDLTQEVMYRLTKANKEIRNVKAWLFQTTRNVIADYYRKNEKDPIVKTSENVKAIPDKSEDATLNEVDFVIPMIKLLPEKYSHPLMMSDIEELPQKEIANRMDLGLSATKMRIHRARKKLHNLFFTCCDIEFDTNGDFAGCTIKDHCNSLKELGEAMCEEHSTL